MSKEVIGNALTGNQHESLFGVMNQTKTVVGARLLRATLLRPLTDIKTIGAGVEWSGVGLGWVKDKFRMF